jgi:hypothetical protein
MIQKSIFISMLVIYIMLHDDNNIIIATEFLHFFLGFG